MTQRVPQQVSEMQFGREYCPTELSVATFRDGTTQLTLSAHGKMRAYQATLGQAIQLRDFLNRHIDGLALQQTGSLAERASDDPTQLASVEEIPHTAFGGEKLEPVKVYGCGRRFRPLHQKDYVRCGDLHGTMRDQRHLCIQCRAKS